MIIQEGIQNIDRYNAAEWSYDFFKHVIDKESFFNILAAETNWDKSLILFDNDKVLGLYLLGDRQLKGYDELVGVEGILLAVDESIRGKGWGTKLKDYPKSLGYDYIWGQQLKVLNNLENWLKRRILVGETEDVYITLEKF